MLNFAVFFLCVSYIQCYAICYAVSAQLSCAFVKLNRIRGNWMVRGFFSRRNDYQIMKSERNENWILIMPHARRRNVMIRNVCGWIYLFYF